MKTSRTGSIAAAFFIMAAMSVCAQSAEDLEKAGKCRAEAAYLEMKGDTAAAVSRYEESLTYYNDESVVRKVEVLKNMLQAQEQERQASEPFIRAPRDGALAGEVLATLDMDADLLVYLNAETLIPCLRAELGKMNTAILSASSPTTDGQAGAVGSMASLVDPLIDWLGLYGIRAVGISLTPVEEGVSRMKTCIRYDEGQFDRVMRRMYGEAKIPKMLNYLPAETVAMEMIGVSPATLWAVIEEGVDAFAAPGVSESMKKEIERLKDSQGMDLRALAASLGDEMVAALTLSESVTVEIPLPNGRSIVLPEPGLLIGVTTKDASLLDAVLALLKKNQIPLSEKTIGGGTLYSVNIPAKLPFSLQPALMMHEGCLLLASTPAILERALQSVADGGEWMGQDAVKAAFRDRPAAVSAMAYAGSRFSQEYCRLQSSLADLGMDRLTDGSCLGAVLNYYVDNIVMANADNFCATYQVNDASGMMSVSYMKTPYGNPLALAAMTPVALGAMMGISAMEQAENNAARSACALNRQQIDMAKRMWAMDQGVDAGTPTWEDLAAYFPDGAAPECPLGGEYTLGSLEEDVACSLPDHAWADSDEVIEYEETVDESYMDEEGDASEEGAVAGE